MSQSMLAKMQILLAQQGMQAGSVVAISGPSSYTYLTLLWAIWQSGASALTLNPRLPLSERERVLKQADACLLISDQMAEIPTLQWSSLPLVDQSQWRKFKFHWDFPAEQILSLILTSGSSSQPKLAMHSAANHYYSAIGSAQNIPLEEDACTLLSLPLYHVGGLASVIRAWISQTQLVLPEHNQSLEQAIHTFQPSHVSMVPTQLIRLLADPEQQNAIKQIRHLLLGGSAIPQTLIEDCFKAEIPIHCSYGSSEMTSQISCTPPGCSLETLMSAGYLLPERQLDISANQEIRVRGKTLFQGYYDQGNRVLPLDAEGWLATRDCGYLDQQGRLHVTGRLDRQFISGGENIQPEEIEQHLLNIHGIQQVRVLPVTDPDYGQRPVAFVQSEHWQELAWRNTLRDVLPTYKCPDHFYPWPSHQIGLKPTAALFSELISRYHPQAQEPG